MVKWLVRIVGGLVALVAVVFGLQVLASESGEVVVLHTQDDAGAVVTTRLWVVDHEGRQYLRGTDGSGWYARLTANPEVELARGAEPVAYRAVPAPAARDIVNELMQAKYGWRDSLIEVMVGGRDDAIPVRLEPR